MAIGIEGKFLEWVRAADTEILLCWDMGHIWTGDLYSAIERGPHGAHLCTGSCARGCGVERTRYLSSTWEPESNKNTYKYPKGYSPKGISEEFREGFFMDRRHRAIIREEIAKRKGQ